MKKVQQEFGVSRVFGITVKEAGEEGGILSFPDPSCGPSLPSETVIDVCSFYESDDISCVMPGKKDFVSVKERKRQYFQKRLVLSNLRGVYHEFKERFPDHKIGFSELRPKHCVLAGTNGTHLVCVCTIHHNVKLMLLVQEMQIPELPTV